MSFESWFWVVAGLGVFALLWAMGGAASWAERVALIVALALFVAFAVWLALPTL
jgi:hypothetical protein